MIFGEKDILKTAQLLPGIKSAGEGSSGFHVRGGSTDQNLVLLDEAPVYNASHLLGFFSTFNSDALKDVTIIKGNSPAQYGGRLSSVLDVKMKDGNNKNFNATGGIGTISTRLSIESPFAKERGSFIVSGRRTYADLFLKLSEDNKENKLYFYDFNAKANYRINDKNRIYISGYLGRDVLAIGKTFGIDWGNKTATARWNYVISPKLFSNASFIYSDYDYNINFGTSNTENRINSRIQDFNLKEELQYYVGSKNTLKFGFNSIRHKIIPTRFTAGNSVAADKNGRLSLENAVFANNTWRATEKLTLDYGLRLSAYTILGGDTYNIYDKGILTDSVVLASGKFGKTYFNAEPRFQFNYIINEQSSLKGGYARNTQHLHLLSNTTSTSPTDQWIGDSYNIKPEISDQLSLGYARNFKNNKCQTSIEIYYKSMKNQIDYKDGADINTTPDVESELLFGKGRAYGAEFLVKKVQGKLTGWVAYTLSKTERKINGINNNNWYNAKQDRTHDISIVGVYQLSPKWSLSGVFVYNTGNAATVISHSTDENTLKHIKPELFIHPMSKWRLYSDFENGKNTGGFIKYVRMFGILGLIVLLIACINFMNLSTARSEKRAKEVGVRKAVGSGRKQLINQFLNESVLMAAFAFLLALVIVVLALPYFNKLTDKEMSLQVANPVFWVIMILFLLLPACSQEAILLFIFPLSTRCVY